MKEWIMTAQNFKNTWINNERDFLSPIDSTRLARFNLEPSTKEFLNVAGLPTFASPNLSFVDNTDHIYSGINKLIDRYEFNDDKTEFEKYIVIGSCRDGDMIAINTRNNDEVEQLDHEDNFSSKFFNSSIQNLANFLIIYRDFEKSVSEECGIYGFFTDTQFEKMSQAMLAVDARALTENGFWKDELEINLQRQLYLNKKEM